jgi:hypothetical protein
MRQAAIAINQIVSLHCRAFIQLILDRVVAGSRIFDKLAFSDTFRDSRV